MKSALAFIIAAGVLVADLMLTGPAQAATLLHQYSFTDGVTDSIGGAGGSLLNGATVSGGALTLDGIDDFVQFGAHLVPVTGSYSVALFARQASAQNIHVEFISQGLTGGQGFYIGHDPLRRIRASDSWLNTGLGMPSVGDWHHYALVVDAPAASSVLYVDGVASATLGFTITSTASGSDTRLGAQFQNFGEFLHGQLDEIAIFDGALSANDVSGLAAVSPGVVPLPGAAWLFIPGIATLLARGRRR